MLADHFGELFWEPDVRKAVQEQELLLFPGVPFDGKAPENPTFVGQTGRQGRQGSDLRNC